MPRAEAAAPLLSAVVGESVEVSIAVATATAQAPEATKSSAGSPGLSDSISAAPLTQDAERRRTFLYGAGADMVRADVERTLCEVEEGQVTDFLVPVVCRPT